MAIFLAFLALVLCGLLGLFAALFHLGFLYHVFFLSTQMLVLNSEAERVILPCPSPRNSKIIFKKERKREYMSRSLQNEFTEEQFWSLE